MSWGSQPPSQKPKPIESIKEGIQILVDDLHPATPTPLPEAYPRFYTVKATGNQSPIPITTDIAQGSLLVKKAYLVNADVAAQLFIGTTAFPIDAGNAQNAIKLGVFAAVNSSLDLSLESGELFDLSTITVAGSNGTILMVVYWQ